MKKFWVLFFSLLNPSYAAFFDNGVLGDPFINCGSDNIEIRFDTRNSFKGIIFVEDQIKNPECRSLPTNNPQNLASRNAAIKLRFNSCGLEKRFSSSPKGLFISTTIILSFNPDFLSKIDRIYKIQCFYMEMITRLEKQIQVTMPPPPLQTQSVPMPVCRYEVLEGSPTGQPVYYATVGQQVYHKWTCDTETENQFFHSCTVDDGNGDKVLLIDEKGCAQDKYLLQNLDYVSDLMIGKEAHVYKYADRPSMYFDCQISLSIKEPNQQYCDVPSCPDPPRRRRHEINATKEWEEQYESIKKNIKQNKSNQGIQKRLKIEKYNGTMLTECVSRLEFSLVGALNVGFIVGAICLFGNSFKLVN